MRGRIAMRAIRQFWTFNRPVQLLLLNQLAITIGFFMLMPYLSAHGSLKFRGVSNIVISSRHGRETEDYQRTCR
jgi:hypothetical protein